jgi:hypothetical protein
VSCRQTCPEPPNPACPDHRNTEFFVLHVFFSLYFITLEPRQQPWANRS